MPKGAITVDRYDPAKAACVAHQYSVPLKPGSTVLEVLLHIYENHDSTFAFRYGCRCSKCGACAVDVNGIPRLACWTNAENGMTVSPLKNLPRVRDLVVDRSPLDRRLTEYGLYISPGVSEPLGTVMIPQSYQRLIGCLECYGCVSSCPNFDWRDLQFAGPSIFVRLAQLHLDPRDNADRRAQAISLGIERCRDCAQCRCVKGIAIRRDAIGVLLGEVVP